MAILKVRQPGGLALIVLIRKTPEFFAQILDMMDHGLRKSIRSIDKDMEVSEFLSRQLVRKDILYCTNKMRKRQFLS